VADCIRIALAWASIVDDVNDGRLNIDLIQKKQAEKELQAAGDVLPRVARECYKWLVCPVQHTPTESKVSVEAFPLNTSGSALAAEIERVCLENELVITTWSPIHLRTKLAELYWKPEKTAVLAMAFWDDTMRYLYLPRLRSRSVLEQAVAKGAASRDFFGTAYGQQEGKFDGFKLGDANVQFDGTLLLIEPEAAAAYEAAHFAPARPTPDAGGAAPQATPSVGRSKSSTRLLAAGGAAPATIGAPAAATFIGTADVKAATAKMRLVQIAEEIINLLASDPQATVTVTLEIAAEFPNGVSETIRRAVAENAASLGFKNKTWETSE
jgi:hypothetical protein